MIRLAICFAFSLALSFDCVLPLAANEPVNLVFEDQFEGRPELKAARGRVVVLVYGDRRASDACRDLGEQLHLTFHPTAKGLPPEKARLEPAAPPPKLPTGQSAPGVLVQPVACCGKMPATLRPLLRTQIAKASPNIPIWLDFNETMAKHFGLTTGEPNLVLFDPQGRFRHRHTGVKQAQLAAIIDQIQDLRREPTP